MVVRFYRLNKKTPSPCYMSERASGMDLFASIENPVNLQPGERALIPAGFKISLPPGYEAQIRPRSGLALEHGITVLNTPGTIDSDYRGEVKIILINHGKETFTIENGMRIAQLVISKVLRVELLEVDNPGELEDTERNEGGFGHTGI